MMCDVVKKTVAFIPIKMNSERLPNKNILSIGEKPLCWHIANTALNCHEIDEVYVFCSDERITQYMPKGIHFLKRDERLDGKYVKGLEIYQEFVKKIKSDIYVLMHATSPFLKSSSVDCALKKVKNEGYDSSFSVQKIQTFVWYQNHPLNYSLTDVPRTQDMEPIFVETSSFYIFERSVIESGRRIGNHPYLHEVDYVEGIDIDERKDFDFAKTLERQLQR